MINRVGRSTQLLLSLVSILRGQVHKMEALARSLADFAHTGHVPENARVQAFIQSRVV
jgi:hypothetical protein